VLDTFLGVNNSGSNPPLNQVTDVTNLFEVIATDYVAQTTCPPDPSGYNYGIWHVFFDDTKGYYRQAPVLFSVVNPLGSPGLVLNWSDNSTDIEKLKAIENLLDPMQEVQYVDTINGVSNNTVNDIAAPNAWGVDVHIVAPATGIDNWYQQPDTGRYGFVVPIYTTLEASVYGSFQWINFTNQRVLFLPRG
jgi:hypothetical protein